jgi:hypothetical protein
LTERDPLGELGDLPWPKPAAPSASISQAIHRDCTKGLSSKECTSARRRAALTLLFPTLAIGILSFLALRSPHAEGALGASLYGAIGWSVVLSAVLLVGLARPPGKRPAPGVRLVMAVLVPIAFFVYLALTASARLPFASFSQGESMAHAMRCGAACLVLGAIVTGAVLLLWRRTDPMTPGISGALAGLTGGIGSALAFGVACPSHEAWHLGLSHGLVVVALVILGGAVGRRLLSP